MTIDQLNTIIEAGDIDKMIGAFAVSRLVKEVETALKQYDPKQHTIFDKSKRQDKILKDNDGNLSGVVNVARLPLSLQKKITLISAAFLGTPTIESSPEADIEKNFLTIIDKVWQDNKLDYKFKKIAKTVMSEKECAEVWFMQEAEQANAKAGIVGYWEGFPIMQTAKFKLGMKLLSNSLGDSLYPVFDEFSNMIAFGRGYKIIDAAGKSIEYFDLYTAEKLYFYSKETGAWEVDEKPNVIKKIPIIYYWQPLTEWDDVQELIERLEVKKSNHADTNDYFDRPMLVGKGDTISLPDKGDSGKYVELKGHDASLTYLTWDQAPASMEMEMDGLYHDIHTLTHTPDISFENVKGLGVFSGIALKMLFLDAHLKASDKEEIFGEGLQRRINYIKKAVSVIDPAFVKALPLQVKPKFEFFMPKNIQEEISVLVAAVSGGIMSEETAIRLNPLIADADAEIKALNEKAEAKAAKELEIANANKPEIPAPQPAPTNGLPV